MKLPRIAFPFLHAGKKRRTGSEQKRGRQIALEKAKLQGGRCFYCECVMTYGDEPQKDTTMTTEHLTPRAAGGATTWANIVAACARCNHVDQNPKIQGPMGASVEDHNLRQRYGLDGASPPRNMQMAHALIEAFGAERIQDILQEARRRGARAA